MPLDPVRCGSPAKSFFLWLIQVVCWAISIRGVNWIVGSGTLVCGLLATLNASGADGLSYSGKESSGVVQRPTFRIFDATLYKDKPNLAAHGIEPIYVIYAQFLYEGNKLDAGLPSRRKVRQVAGDLVTQARLVVVDIEHWPMTGNDEAVAESVTKFETVIDWLRTEHSALKLGFYGLFPIRDYWRAIKGQGSKDYLKWQSENERFRAILAGVDAVFPSLYTFYPDRQNWVRFAIEQIREARRFEKPVYVFLWPQYHESNRLLGEKYLPDDFWKLQLETARKYADGIVIWGGWAGKGPAQWDERAAWWRVTKDFMSMGAGRSSH
jgi:hypothetical protein